ncbi:MAG: DUF4179 domain-containing protein [Clostridia bacterium]|nr:DUF4179 domain-containing protein [Clostridia bacterium]
MNKKRDELDDVLFEHFKNKNIPSSISEGIDKALYKYNDKQKSISRIKKAIIAITSICTITGGIVFASTIVRNLFSYNHSIEQAVENNYVQNIDMDYISTDDLSFKVSYLVMDDINFNLVFDFIVNDNLEDYQGITLNNLKITDDQGNQIINDTEGDELYNNYALLHSSWKIIEKKDNCIRQILTANSFNFPESNALYISFSGVTVYKVDNGNAKTRKYNGDWLLEINVEEQLKNRSIKFYKCSDKRVEAVKITNSGFVIKVKSEDYLENLQLYDDKGNQYKMIYNVQNRNMDLKKYVDDEWIIFFDTCVYDEVREYTLVIDGSEFLLYSEED